MQTHHRVSATDTGVFRPHGDVLNIAFSDRSVRLANFGSRPSSGLLNRFFVGATAGRNQIDADMRCVADREIPAMVIANISNNTTSDIESQGKSHGFGRNWNATLQPISEFNQALFAINNEHAIFWSEL